MLAIRPLRALRESGSDDAGRRVGARRAVLKKIPVWLIAGRFGLYEPTSAERVAHEAARII